MHRFEHPFIQSKLMSADDVAMRLPRKATFGTSGFTPAGYPKVIPGAFAARIDREQKEGHEFSFNLYTGASTGDELDGVLARTGCMKLRLPFQSNTDLRNGINSGQIDFIDMHLSKVALYIEHGLLDPIDVAIVEACDVTADGRIYLTTSAGMSSTYIHSAREVYIELNESVPVELKGYHDIYTPKLPPQGRPIFINHVDDRIGAPYVQCDPEKIKGIVRTNKPDSNAPFKRPDDTSIEIAGNILEFILHEIRKGRIPAKYLPFQVGVGNVANAVLACMAGDDRFGAIEMYTEVLMDSFFDLIDARKLHCASTSALTLSADGQKRFFGMINELRQQIILRPQELSNHPEMIRRMGILSMNTALEMDIFGNVNSTHVLGSKMMNGIGGSGDFTRNAYLSIFMAPSTQKGGAISSIVPMVSHVDHSEHSTMIFVTEQGLADLRGLAPRKRAEKIIEKCVHPSYKDLLRDYLRSGMETAPGKHTPHCLSHSFDFHLRFMEHGTMLKEES